MKEISLNLNLNKNCAVIVSSKLAIFFLLKICIIGAHVDASTGFQGHFIKSPKAFQEIFGWFWMHFKTF